MNNTLMRMLQRILTPLLFPFKKYIYRPRHIFRTIPRLIIRKVQRLLKKLVAKKKDVSLKHYFSMGRYYVSKKLVLILSIGLLVAIIYLSINTPEFLKRKTGEEVIVLHETIGEDLTQSGTVQLFDSSNILKYEGDMVDGLFHGAGKLYDSDGQLVYEGEFSEGVKEGQGKEYSDQGTLTYEGSFEKDVRHGSGKSYDDEERLVYNGQFENNLMNGLGEIYHPEGHLLYKGSFINNVYSGQGATYHNNQNISYTGEFQNGQFSGTGKLFDYQGTLIYEGEFHQGLFSGQGTQYDPSGFIVYQGQFIVGKYHGEGEQYYENGEVKYKGAFSNDIPHGKGSFFDQEGQLLYEGLFHQGYYHGSGTLYNQDGFGIYKGFFENGQVALHRFLQLSHSRVVELLGEPTVVKNKERMSTNVQETMQEDDMESDIEDDNIEPLPLDINDMNEFDIIYNDYQISFTIERDEDNPNLTKVSEIHVWGSELLEQVKLDIDHLYTFDKSAGVPDSVLETEDGKLLSLYLLDTTLYTFYFHTDHETLIQLKIKSFRD